jgi:peroxiredoxin
MRTTSSLGLCAVLVVLGCASAGPTSSQPHQASATSSSSPFDSTPPTPSIAVTPEMGSPHLGDSAPDFELTDQNGKSVSLASLRGSVVLLAFVTSWCPFSEAEQPYLKRLAEDYRGKNIKVVAVDVKEDDAGYRKYLDRVPMPFPVARDTKGAVVLSYTPARAQPDIKDRGLVLITSNLVLDEEGRVAFFTMADTLHFDARLVHARRTIDGLLAKEGSTKP